MGISTIWKIANYKLYLLFMIIFSLKQSLIKCLQVSSNYLFFFFSFLIYVCLCVHGRGVHQIHQLDKTDPIQYLELGWV